MTGIPRGESEPVNSEDNVRFWWIAPIMIGVLAVVLGILLFTGEDGPRFEQVDVDGIDCVYDNSKDEIVGCDWGPR